MTKPLAFSAALAALVLSACGGESAEKAETRVEGAAIRTEGSGVNTTAIVEADDRAGVAIGAGAAADAGPVFARPYPGSRVISSATSPADSVGLITFQTDAPVETLIAYYRERAEEAGFSTLADMTMGGSRHFGAEASSGGEFNVVVQPQDGQSTVTVTWEGVSG